MAFGQNGECAMVRYTGFSLPQVRWVCARLTEEVQGHRKGGRFNIAYRAEALGQGILETWNLFQSSRGSVNQNFYHRELCSLLDRAANNWGIRY